MSFMYNPFPYDDPMAINPINVSSQCKDSIVLGLEQTGRFLAEKVVSFKQKKGRCVVALDGFVSAPFSVLSCIIARTLSSMGVDYEMVDGSCLYKEEGVLEKDLLQYLPEDQEFDPPLLYGRLYKAGYPGLWDEKKLYSLRKKLLEAKGVVILYGNGVLDDTLSSYADVRCFLDMTQKKTILNIKSGRCLNLGYKIPQSYKRTLRHAYYVDFEVAGAIRGTLLKENKLDYYLACDNVEQVRLLDIGTYRDICNALVANPFRCRPVYIEGVWGGYYVQHLRNLPQSMKNCAWVFDLIPMEVSIVADMDGLQVEFPFYGFVQTVSDQLMGPECTRKFKGYFPVRFNYDDTFHSSGNMSIQCHPGSAYVKKHYDELGRQDESYYIVVAGQGAKTYCGFKESCDVEAFLNKCRKSEKDHHQFDYDVHVHSESSKPGMQFLIPAGTIHASGRNQVILEIGSLTIGSYTYKMYDYCRKDLDGNQRPIHLISASEVLVRDRKENWVHQNLIQVPRIVRKEEDGKEIIVGEHELLYFTLRNLCFHRRMVDDTKGVFHVLVLVEGEQVRIRSLAHPEHFFVQHYMDMVVVPASFGPYELLNEGVGEIVIHKTMLRDGYEQMEL